MARSSDAPFPLSLLRDKSFQVRQIRRVALLGAFFVLQSTLLLGAFHHEMLGRLVAGNAPLLFASEDIGSLAAAVPGTGAVMLRWLVVMMVLNAVVTATIGTWIVRKLGNPMLAMRRALDEIGDGNLDVRLRAGDAEEFDELANALNRALASVQSRIEGARDATRAVEPAADQPLPDPATLRAALVTCREQLDWFDRAPPGTPGRRRAGDAAAPPTPAANDGTHGTHGRGDGDGNGSGHGRGRDARKGGV